MKFKGLAALLLLVGAAVVGGAPYYTVHQLREAVKSSDANALAQHVDFDSVRTSFKMQMASSINRHVPAAAQGGLLAGLGAAVANSAADAVLSTVVTPEGMVQALQGRLSLPWPASPAPAQPPSEPEAASGTVAEGPKTSARYLSWEQFQVSVPVKGHAVNLLLTRQSLLSWRVTSVELPDWS